MVIRLFRRVWRAERDFSILAAKNAESGLTEEAGAIDAAAKQMQLCSLQ
jgi:hypothetical protein